MYRGLFVSTVFVLVVTDVTFPPAYPSFIFLYK